MVMTGNQLAGSISDTTTALTPTAVSASADAVPCDVTGAEFRCSPLECIAGNLTCDGVPHCSSGADEAVPLCGECWAGRCVLQKRHQLSIDHGSS